MTLEEMTSSLREALDNAGLPNAVIKAEDLGDNGYRLKVTEKRGERRAGIAITIGPEALRYAHPTTWEVSCGQVTQAILRHWATVGNSNE